MKNNSKELVKELNLFKTSGVCRWALIFSSLFVVGLRYAFTESPSSKKRKHRIHNPEFVQTLLLANNAYTMDEVCGQLLKQSDVWGMWNSRYMRLACLDSDELAEIKGIDPRVVEQGMRCFVFMYWVGDAATASSTKYRNNPRGIYLLDGCWIEHDQSKPDLMTIHGLRNALNVKNLMGPMTLKTTNIKALHRWISAITFASIATLFQQSDDDESKFPYKSVSKSIGLVSSPTSEVIHETQYFRLVYTMTKRRYLLSWDNEDQAKAKPFVAQNIYEVSNCSVKLTKESPLVLILEDVRDTMVLNSHKSFGKLFLKMDTRSNAEEWAKKISSKCTIEPIPLRDVSVAEKESLVDELVFTNDRGETVVDEITFDSISFVDSNSFLDDFNDNTDSENVGSYANNTCQTTPLTIKKLQMRESWESPRPAKLSPVVEDDNESRRSSVGSVSGSRRSSFGILFR